jgi:hypothetical protein
MVTSSQTPQQRRPVRESWRRFRARVARFLSTKLQRKGPEAPEDPRAYVTAPKKPRLPHLSATAVAEFPEP